LKVIIEFYEQAEAAIKKGAPILKIREMGLSETITRLRSSVPNDKLDELEKMGLQIKMHFDEMLKMYN